MIHLWMMARGSVECETINDADINKTDTISGYMLGSVSLF